MDKEGRLTYRSAFGDYGTTLDCVNDHANLCRLYNRLGAYEDLGSVAELAALKEAAEAHKAVLNPADVSEGLALEGWFK